MFTNANDIKFSMKLECAQSIFDDIIKLSIIKCFFDIDDDQILYSKEFSVSRLRDRQKSNRKNKNESTARVTVATVQIKEVGIFVEKAVKLYQISAMDDANLIGLKSFN
uniref:Uncharacterized protein n=1 Tax=Glossina austeni TaxID=7395 RepID=A0A1A9VBP3_GLOAU